MFFFCRAVGTGYRFQPTGKLCCSRYACHLILVAGSMNEIFLVVFICFLFVRIPERACRQRMKIFFFLGLFIVDFDLFISCIRCFSFLLSFMLFVNFIFTFVVFVFFIVFV